ncbi:hypothetical protein [Streptomyces aidingensis]|uniref:Uncharacterized protein n=1 Tax=Streptomyces aidingensis TaxID=910347 RepID=A0A1I1UU68_9ACTN|nr:hypothetical protein [Streptomyces aidingensis]SFD74372.1 hypothetical protein SAMN05421773_12717 [Streptomyces aidingensis]
MTHTHDQTGPAGPIAPRTRRTVTRVLRIAARTTAPIAAAVMIAALLDIVAPAASPLTLTSRDQMMLTALAAYGAHFAGRAYLTSAADWIDPDAHDGDRDADLAADALVRIAEDLRAGADPDHVAAALREYQVLPAAAAVLTQLSDRYRHDGRTELAYAALEAADRTGQAAAMLDDAAPDGR